MRRRLLFDSIIFWIPQLVVVWIPLMILMAADIDGNTVVAAEATAKTSTKSKNEWYTKYPIYHPYCSTPSQMETRKIPPLMDRPQETRLVHVTSIIRHGARTPYAGAPTVKCWEGYWENPKTGIWDCALTTMMAPPPPHEIVLEEEGQEQPGDEGNEQDAMFLFEKKYVALDDNWMSQSNYRLRNSLNGTCQVGQLLLRGYEQQISNGHILRDAYFYDSSKVQADNHTNLRMKLADLSDTDQLPFTEPNLYYRADDDQRTLMSGQALLRGLFGEELATYAAESSSEGGTTSKNTIITLHTADRKHDILSCNSDVCPRLKDLSREAVTSKGYQTLDNSEESQFLRTYMSNELNWNIKHSAIDCLMTTMCTDRPLPDLVNDYNGLNSKNNSGLNLLERIYNLAVSKWIFVQKYNNAAYAKLGMAPLWREIWDNISPIIGNTQQQESLSSTKLALFSGHDDTIIPLMASLGNRVWNLTDLPPYASMMLIEVHEFVHDDDSNPPQDDDSFKSKFAFRLVYNGNVMTPLVDDCPSDSDLCDVQILQDKVESIITPPWNCESDILHSRSDVKKIPNTDNKDKDDNVNDMPTSGGFLSIFVTVIVSAAAGAFSTFVYLTRKLPFLSKYEGNADHVDSEVPLVQKSSMYGSTA